MRTGWTIIRFGEVELRLRGAGAFTGPENLEARFPVGEGRGRGRRAWSRWGRSAGQRETRTARRAKPAGRAGFASLDGWGCRGTKRDGAPGAREWLGGKQGRR